jgi:hypothetical protein
MAASMRSDRRIARAGAAMRAHGQVPDDRRTLPTIQFQSGCIDLHPKSGRDGHISVALTSRGRDKQHRSRGMSTRIRALVHEQTVDASTIAFG